MLPTAPIKPMLAKRVDELPEGDFIFEPKWDGFRCLVFVTPKGVYLQSRDLKPLNRYFPELERHVAGAFSQPCVLDGEIVIAIDGRLEFEALLLRIHPAASRVAMLAEKTPASLVLWDLLGEGEQDYTHLPFAERRARLEACCSNLPAPIHLTPVTRDLQVARDWFHRFEGAGLDGVMAKPAAEGYQPGVRSMFKVKHERTADCVVAGFRWHKKGKGTLLGSLLLGLYDQHGDLQHVGVAASFTQKRRAELVQELAPLREGALEAHPWRHWAEGSMEQRLPGATSRWNRDKDLSWVPLRPERVVEVRYDHMQGRRFRHTTHFKRWRPDKAPRDCTYEQLEVTPPLELAEIFR